MVNPERNPDPRLTVEVDGQTQDIFMSFGLVAELAGYVGSIERVSAIDLDPNLAMLIIDKTLAPRDKQGRVTDPQWIAPSLDQGTAISILDFVGKHVLHFFIQGLRRGISRLDANKEQLQAVASLLNSTEKPNSPT